MSDKIIFKDNISDAELIDELLAKTKSGEIIPDRFLVKPQNISEVMKKRICSKVVSSYKDNQSKFTKAEYAKELDITPGQLSLILRYDHRKFSLDFMIQIIEKLAEKDHELALSINRLATAI
ncbi:MAG: hypothetical protein PHY93_15115 [Bacteriovorax sp.]|nr:hypothetical protein [Bacteriovorax sp.]